MSATITPEYPADPYEEMRRQMDEEIAQLEARLLMLKLARNNLTPIARLHPELIQEVFDLLHHSSGFDHRGRDVLFLTWVCHRWRDIAHQTSSLWYEIHFSNLEWVRAAISHTRGRELEFYVDLDQERLKRTPFARLWANRYTPPFMPTQSTGKWVDREQEFVRLCLGNLFQIKKLSLIDAQPDVQAVILPAKDPEWLIPAPILTHLYFDGISVPPNLFSGIYPSLQSLVLHGCGLDWDTIPVIPNLPHLSIAEATPRTTIHKLVKILRVVARNVETIEFRDILNWNDLPSDPVDRLYFPKLNLLQLNEIGSDMVVHLLKAFSLHNRTSVEVYVEDPDNVEDDLIPALVSTRGSQKWPFYALVIRAGEERATLRIEEDEPNADGSDELEPGENDPKRTHIQLEFAIQNPTRTITVLQSLPIDPLSIQRVRLTDRCNSGIDVEILDYLETLGTIHELKITLSNVQSFHLYLATRLVRLKEEIGEDWEQTDPTKIALAQSILCFSGLRKLYISKASKHHLETLPMLHGWLLWRKAYGMPLDVLYVSNMEVPSLYWMQHHFDVVAAEFEMSDVTETTPGGSTSN